MGTGACAATSAKAWSGSNCGEEALFGAAPPVYVFTYDGAFDHIYETGTGKSGYIWACPALAPGNPGLSAVPINSTGGIVTNGSGNVISSTNVITAISSLTSEDTSCSPVTEFWGSDGGTDDYIFLSVENFGSLAACTGSCLYNFVVGTGGTAVTAGTEHTPTTATAGFGLASPSNTSGTIIDNLSSTAGASQIYFIGEPAAGACGGNGVTGNSTGTYCAMQASQTAP
jgi:hypothetical protein